MKAATLGLIFLSFGASAGFAASPFDGKWTGVFMRPQPAGDQAVTITLATDEMGRVTGSMTLAGVPDPVAIEWGYIKDDLVVYKIVAPGPAGVAPFVYVGKLAGDRIDFGRRPEDLKVGYLVKGTAQKAL